MALFTEAALAAEVAPLGADPLEVGEAEFCERIRSRGVRIKALLLDQHVLRGVGNIYADESLWRARIHPAQTGARLTRAQAAKLRRTLQKILRRAIALRGSSISDYVDSEGRRGKFQQRHRVYQRKGKKCFRCGAAIRRAIVAGRSSYFCPGCQPSPRTRRRKR